METRKMLQWVLLGIGITIIVGYSLFVLEGLIRGPQIELTSPSNGVATTTPLIEVSGRAFRTTVLTLNDSPVALDLQGNFKEHILLGLGYNILRVRSSDRYNRSDERVIEMTLLPGATAADILATSTQATSTTQASARAASSSATTTKQGH